MTRSSSVELGKHLFSAAIITDTHVNPDENECNSPFPVNRLANSRLRFVINQLNQHDIDFVVHLGDLVHPVPCVPELYGKAAKAFHEIIKPLKHPIYFTPGNHDVGDKPINWGPTKTVTREYLDVWHNHFNADYQQFEFQDVQFFIINNEIINTGLEQEKTQQIWLEQALETFADKRIVMFTHYPLFLTSDTEDEHYDNMAEPGRSWLLDLIRNYRVEAVFAGHVHNFWYHRYHQSDYYILPSTSFVRQDFSEMYRIEPGQEAGRNDVAKLGYAIMNVYQHGHTVNIVRTNGEQLSPDDVSHKTRTLTVPTHPRELDKNTPGVDLRQCWCEYSEIPPSGGLDEFDRKIVRNDYPLLALWEFGIKKLRIPFADLNNPLTRARMYDLVQQGHEFTLFSYGIVSNKQVELVNQHRSLIMNWEIGFIEQELEPLVFSIQQINNINIYFSPIKDAHEKSVGNTFYHTIQHGFSIDDKTLISELKTICHNTDINPGLIFRIRMDDYLETRIKQVIEFQSLHNCPVSLHLISSDPNPAQSVDDIRLFHKNIIYVYEITENNPSINIYVDIFADVDRGYFVRKGFVNRRYNPNFSLQKSNNHFLTG